MHPQIDLLNTSSRFSLQLGAALTPGWLDHLQFLGSLLQLERFTLHWWITYTASLLLHLRQLTLSWLDN